MQKNFLTNVSIRILVTTFLQRRNVYQTFEQSISNFSIGIFLTNRACYSINKPETRLTRLTRLTRNRMKVQWANIYPRFNKNKPTHRKDIEWNKITNTTIRYVLQNINNTCTRMRFLLTGRNSCCTRLSRFPFGLQSFFCLSWIFVRNGTKQFKKLQKFSFSPFCSFFATIVSVCMCKSACLTLVSISQ